MEVREFFAGSWRSLILVPAVTAIIAGVLFVWSVDERFEASGVISIAEYVDGGSPAEVRAAIDDFDSALQSRQALALVAQAAPNAETFRIRTEVIGEGGDVRVLFESTSQASAEQALDAGVREALILVSESVGRQTGRRLVAADAVATDAARSLQDIEAEAGAADLEAELARRSADLLALRNQIAAAAGNSIVQSELEATLQSKQEEIQDIEAQLLAWTNTRARFDLAVASGADASLALRQIETNEADLQTQPLLRSVRSTEVSSLPDLLRVVVAATAVTAGAVVLLALLMGSGRRRGRGGPRTTPVRGSASETPSGGIALLDPVAGESTSWAADDGWDDDDDDVFDQDDDHDDDAFDQDEDDVDDDDHEDDDDDDDAGDETDDDDVHVKSSRS